jgi:hypothetical protein
MPSTCWRLVEEWRGLLMRVKDKSYSRELLLLKLELLQAQVLTQKVRLPRARVVARTNGFRAIVTTALLLGMTLAPVHAHDPATLDSLTAVHGGQVRMAGPFHIELVILGREAAHRDRLVLVYLQNHMFEDVSSDRLKGIVRFLDGQRVTTVSLIPLEANGFSGRGAFDINPSVTAEISITDKDGEIWSVTYTTFAVKVPSARPE